MDDAFVAAGLSIPEYEESCGGIVTLIPRSTKDKNVHKDVHKDVHKELSERQVFMLNLIKENPKMNRTEMSTKTGVNEKTIRRDLADLQNRGLIVRVGGRKNGHWEIKNN